MHHPIRVLFVCDGGSARSQMAEALLRTLGGKDFEVRSAGLEPEALNPLASKVMQEIGIPVAGQHVNHINDYEAIQFDYVITLCDQARDSCLAFPRDIDNLHWSCPDPTEAQGSEEKRLVAFRNARDHIRKQIEIWIPEA